MKTSKTSSSKPVCVFSFDDDWPEARNSLFTDAAGQFYLGDFRSGESENVEPVTVHAALAWYAECNKYACQGSSGSIGKLCAAAAEQLLLKEKL
jgi:hypothetical protein